MALAFHKSHPPKEHLAIQHKKAESKLVTVKGDNVSVRYDYQLHLRFVVPLKYDPSG